MIKPFYYLKEIEKYPRKHLALLLGVSQQTIWRWEGIGMPSHKVKGTRYYVLEEVKEWMKNQPKLLELYVELIIKIEKSA